MKMKLLLIISKVVMVDGPKKSLYKINKRKSQTEHDFVSE